MPTYMTCERCWQTARRFVQDGYKFYCVDCAAMMEPIPYDRLHYFEDEDLFSEDARDEDASHDECDLEEDE